MNMTLTQKIKVKAISQNNRKKIRKHNWKTFEDENPLIDNIMKFSAPLKKGSKSKLNTTMAIYNKKPNFLPTTISSRETHNQSQNSRSSKKRDLAYMKQMMNKTVLIQNQDYTSFNPHVVAVRDKIGPRMDNKKKNSLVIPKQVMMVSAFP